MLRPQAEINVLQTAFVVDPCSQVPRLMPLKRIFLPLYSFMDSSGGCALFAWWSPTPCFVSQNIGLPCCPEHHILAFDLVCYLGVG